METCSCGALTCTVQRDLQAHKICVLLTKKLHLEAHQYVAHILTKITLLFVHEK